MEGRYSRVLGGNTRKKSPACAACYPGFNGCKSYVQMLFVLLLSTHGRMLLRVDSACGFSSHSPIAIQVSDIELLSIMNTPQRMNVVATRNRSNHPFLTNMKIACWYPRIAQSYYSQVKVRSISASITIKCICCSIQIPSIWKLRPRKHFVPAEFSTTFHVTMTIDMNVMKVQGFVTPLQVLQLPFESCALSIN